MYLPVHHTSNKRSDDVDVGMRIVRCSPFTKNFESNFKVNTKINAFISSCFNLECSILYTSLPYTEASASQQKTSHRIAESPQNNKTELMQHPVERSAGKGGFDTLGLTWLCPPWPWFFLN